MEEMNNFFFLSHYYCKNSREIIFFSKTSFLLMSECHTITDLGEFVMFENVIETSFDKH